MRRQSESDLDDHAPSILARMTAMDNLSEADNNLARRNATAGYAVDLVAISLAGFMIHDSAIGPDDTYDRQAATGRQQG